jgi:hypothetical protein
LLAAAAGGPLIVRLEEEDLDLAEEEVFMDTFTA